MSVVTSGASLGTATDGTVQGLRIPSGQVLLMTYDATQGVWVGPSTLTMRTVQNEGITSGGAPGVWRYPGPASENPSTRTLAFPFGFHIHKVMYGGQLWAAGLRLQEHLSAEMMTTDLSGTTVELPQTALAWYPLATADPFLSPVSFNHGVRLTGTRDNSGISPPWRWFSTGWQNQPALATPPASDEHLYPEIYQIGPGHNLRNFTAHHRWVYGNVGSTGSGEQASRYPIDSTVAWYVAEDIPVADGASVSEWGNYAGRVGTLVQATGSKQPVVNRQSGRRYVTFDGTDDILKAADLVAWSQPWSIFLVMRQRNTGGTQQVWLGTGGGGAPLIYRGDATNQVNVWTGGSDFIYNRGSAWPSPWMAWSVTATAGAINVWENLTQVGAGTSGTGGFSGLCVGNNFGESLPAAIDVAEIICVFRTVDNTERTNIVNALNTKYSLF